MEEEASDVGGVDKLLLSPSPIDFRLRFRFIE